MSRFPRAHMMRGPRPFMPRGRGMPCDPSFVPHLPFDMAQVEFHFQRVNPEDEEEEKTFEDLLMQRNKALTPSPEEHSVVQAISTKVVDLLEQLSVNTEGLESAKIDEVKEVGSQKKGTVLAGNRTSDVVIVLKTLPTQEAINLLGNRLIQGLKKTSSEILSLAMCDGGFNVISPEATVRCMVSIVPYNFKRLDPEMHVSLKTMQAHASAIRHAKWFEENASSPITIRILVRLLKDIARRFEGFSSMSPWMLDLLAHYAVMNVPQPPLSLPKAFKRVFQLLASGLFLPGSAGITCPVDVDMGPVRIHSSLSPEEQDRLCATAQTLLRVLTHGGYKQVIGADSSNPLLLTGVRYVNGVCVIPSEAIDVGDPLARSKEEEEQIHESGAPPMY